MYNAYITRIKNLHKHPNADRLQIGECFGNSVIVSMDYEDNQLGVYFPSDGQLSVEFAKANNLLRKKDAAGNNAGGYMDPDKRNITAIKLRGEKSDGLFLPLKSLESFGDIKTLSEGDKIDIFNGHEICRKYIPLKQHHQGRYSAGNRTHRKKVPVAPLFAEHADTEQLAYNLGAFKSGDEIEITLKLHGTSMRTGYLPILKGYKRTFIDKILHREGKPIYEYDYVSGTRRTVLEDFDGSNAFRKQHHDKFVGKLHKGEEIYYEVVGFTDTGAPIMGNGDNTKLNDKNFVKQYGKTTTFSYGCDCAEQAWREDREQDPDKPQSDIYVYRMTMTNEDGFVVEYTPDFMRYRCEQMGVKTVPVFDKFFYIPEIQLSQSSEDGSPVWTPVTNPGEYVLDRAERYSDGPDPIGKTHIREGVVVRIINRPKFCAYKHKNFSFRALSGIVKDTVNVDSMSEDMIAEL